MLAHDQLGNALRKIPFYTFHVVFEAKHVNYLTKVEWI
jgi:hypothetical protein